MSTLTVGTIAEKVTDAGVAVDGVTLKDGGATLTGDLTIGDAEYDFPADMRRVDFDSFSLKPRELVTNGEFASNINSWTTGDGSP